MPLEETLKKLILKHSSSIREFAETVDIPYVKFMDIIERGGLHNCTVANLTKICNALNLDIHALMTGKIKEHKRLLDDMTVEEYCLLSKYRKISMFSNVDEMEQATGSRNDCKEGTVLRPLVSLSFSAELGNSIFDNRIDEIELICTPVSEKSDIVMRISGDSMEPCYHEDDLVGVEYTPVIGVGEVGVFLINGECYIKEKGTWSLMSLNPKYNDILLSINDIMYIIGRVLGKVIEKK